MKKIFEFTNVDNTLVFAFYRNFQGKRKESVKEIKRELEEQYKEDLNSRDFAEFELKNQIVVLKQRVIDLETSLRKISERRLNQS
ncbi:hypothetical protein C2G38_2112012, partial [Gigaspora rosea]